MTQVMRDKQGSVGAIVEHGGTWYNHHFIINQGISTLATLARNEDVSARALFVEAHW